MSLSITSTTFSLNPSVTLPLNIGICNGQPTMPGGAMLGQSLMNNAFLRGMGTGMGMGMGMGMGGGAAGFAKGFMAAQQMQAMQQAAQQMSKGCCCKKKKKKKGCKNKGMQGNQLPYMNPMMMAGAMGGMGNALGNTLGNFYNSAFQAGAQFGAGAAYGAGLNPLNHMLGGARALLGMSSPLASFSSISFNSISFA